MFCENGYNTFIYQPNEQQLCRYIEVHENADSITTSEDFSNEEIQSVFLKWLYQTVENLK